MKKLLEVVKHRDGLVELRVGKRTVKVLPPGISFEDARLEAYEYVWARPQHMWTIRGVVA